MKRILFLISIFIPLTFAATTMGELPCSLTEKGFVKDCTIDLPTNFGTATTSVNLEPGVQYTGTIKAPYNVRPFIAEENRYCIEDGSCYIPFQINRHLQKEMYYRDISEQSYFMITSEKSWYLDTITFYYIGNNEPLAIKVLRNFSNIIPTATVRLVHPDVVREAEREEQKAAIQREMERLKQAATTPKKKETSRFGIYLVAGVAALILIVIVLGCTYAAGQESMQHEVNSAINIAKERDELQGEIKRRDSSQLSKIQKYITDVENDSFFAWRESDAQVREFAEEHRQELLTREKEIIKNWTAFRDDPISHVLNDNYPGLYRRRQEVFEYLALQHAAHSTHTVSGLLLSARVLPNPDPRFSAAIELIERDYAIHRHRAEASWIQEYVEAHAQELLVQADAITADFHAFEDNTELVEYLQAEAPILYRTRIWQMLALAIVEKNNLKPRRPRRTETEVREMKLRQARMKAIDSRDMKLQGIDLVEQFRAELEEKETDPDLIDHLVQEFSDELMGAQDSEIITTGRRI